MNITPGLINLDQIHARQVLESLADGVYITDLNRKILFWNDAAARITGWSTHEVVGRTCYDNVLIHVDKDGHQLCGHEHCPLHRAIQTGHGSHEPMLVFAQHKLGGRVPVEVSVSPMRTPDGAIVGGIEVFRDVSPLMDDLQRAQLIQRGALGCGLPEDARLDFQVCYTPAEIVGGDFYHAEAIADGQYALMVADVMGHGVASALYTMQLRSLWEQEREFLGSPGALLGRLNSHVHRLAGPNGYFATAVVVVVDLNSGTVRFARAGHPAPLLRRKDGPFERLNVPGPALGFGPDMGYKEAERSFQPGDSILCFTDGAVEIPGPNDADLGEQGLISLLETVEFGRRPVDLSLIERQLLERSSAIHLPDDLTLLSIRRLG